MVEIKLCTLQNIIRCTVLISFSSSNPTLFFTNPIQVDWNLWSQTWDAQSLSVETGRSNRVVVKIYQECLFRKPDDIEEMIEQSWHYGHRLAQTEAWAYQRMKSIQGKLISFLGVTVLLIALIYQENISPYLVDFSRSDYGSCAYNSNTPTL